MILKITAVFISAAILGNIRGLLPTISVTFNYREGEVTGCRWMYGIINDKEFVLEITRFKGTVKTFFAIHSKRQINHRPTSGRRPGSIQYIILPRGLHWRVWFESNEEMNTFSLYDYTANEFGSSKRKVLQQYHFVFVGRSWYPVTADTLLPKHILRAHLQACVLLHGLSPKSYN